MSKSERIIYSGFYDTPLAFVVSHGKRQFLFLREFDESLDEYQDKYRVFLLPNIPEDQIKMHWGDIEKQATAFLGIVSVKEVRFDRSLREEIDTDVLRRFLSAR